LSGPAESIAIVGMSGRFPKAATVGELWDNLRNGRECITFFTEEELLAAGARAADLQHPAYVPAAGVVEGIDLLDAGFFGLSPRDAEILDPQHRQFLECAWEALEDGGCDPERSQQSIGVYAGASVSTYAFQLYNNPQLGSVVNDFQILLGNDKDHLATRVAYKLNLRGPAVTLGTACSTSLVATCLAGQSLLDYQCDMAIAGGVTLNVPMKRGYVYEEGGIASPDGHCRPFDAGAKGTVGGNGTAVVLLKRLSEAIADGDRIYAAIRGWGLNNDGSAKVGYTAPSVDGQAEAIALALAMAGVYPDTITMLEAHGTATPLGDPIEFTALCQAWRKASRRSYCALGSLKSNLGHLDSAAGAAGLIKCALSLYHRQIPPSLHFEKPNPKLDVTASPFFVNTELRDWEPECGVRRAAVSSFGIGGTNAHVILEEAPEPPPSSRSRTPQLLVLSARSQGALEQTAQRLADHLEAHPEMDLADVAHTLQLGRREMKFRRTLLAPGPSLTDVVRWLRSKDPRRVTSAVREGKFEGVVFLLPGQGAQHPGMAHGLYESEPVYREIVERASAILNPLLGLDLRELLHSAPAAALRQTRFTQAAVFVVSYAIARLWISWGVKPACLLGHSVGEYTAACLAGVLSFEDALWLMAKRGEILESMPVGSMLAVSLPEADLRHRFDVDLAAVNAPSLCVLSGPVDHMRQVQQALERDGVAVHPLHTSHAFHSRLVDGALPLLQEAMQRIRLNAPAIPYLSNVTGTWIRPQEAQSPEYWCRHLRATVRFSSGLQHLFQNSETILLETGPGQTLTGLARQHSGLPAGRTVLSSCRHVQDSSSSDQDTLLHTLGKLWLAGARIDWGEFYRHERRRRVSLPSYPFEKQRYWIDAAPAGFASTLPQQDDNARQPLENWFYVPRWVRTGPLSPPDPELAETWAVLGDDPALQAPLIQTLQDLGQSLETERSATRVIYCAGEASLESGYFRPLELLQSLSQRQTNVDVLVLVRTCAEHAAATGLATTAPQEYPNLRCRVIEIDATARRLIEAGHAQEILTEALQVDPTPRIAYRGAQRWVLTYEPAPLAVAPPEIATNLEGNYIITGGLGKIGLLFAEFLARRGARSVVLIGRGGPPPEDDPRAVRIKAIEALGTRVFTYAADAADHVQIGAVVAVARSRAGRIHGVFHAAGLTQGDYFPPFGTINRSVSEAHFHAKYQAAKALEDALRDDPPEFFCLLSSISTVLGGLGFGPYAAANAMLDYMAVTASGHTRWIAINWDGWSLEANGGDPSAPLIFAEDGVEALDRILAATDLSQVIVSVRELGARLQKWIHPHAAQASLGHAAAQAEEGHERPEISTEFVGPSTDRQEMIAGIWRDLLGISRIGAYDNFFELGGHSLLAIQVITRLREALGQDVPVRTLFDHPTIAALDEELSKQAGDALQNLLDKVENMPEEEVRSLLRGETRP